MVRRTKSLGVLALAVALLASCMLDTSGSGVGGATGGASSATTGGAGGTAGSTGSQGLGGAGGAEGGGGTAAGGTGGEGGTWTPLEFRSRLKLWLRADSGISLATGVSEWHDQSGNGHVFSQPVLTMQPSLTMLDPNFNGEPTVTFDGTDDWLVAVSASITTETDHTYWIMLRAATADNTNRVLLDTQTGREGIWWSAEAATKVLFFDGGNGRPFSSSILNTGTAQDLVLACDGTAGSARLYQNGTDRGTVSNVGYQLTGASSIGSTYLGGSHYFSGSVAEIGVLEGVVSIDELDDLRGYLTNRY